MVKHPAKRIQLALGTYNWPFSSEGNLILTFGQRFKRMASEINVKEPEIKAWLAIIVAIDAMIIPMGRNHVGIIL